MSERSRLLREIQQIHFMMVEAGLFLNNQSDCKDAQETFAVYQKKYKEARAEYEKCYGPLTYNGINVECDGWSWVDGPWPWEVEEC